MQFRRQIRSIPDSACPGGVYRDTFPSPAPGATASILELRNMGIRIVTKKEVRESLDARKRQLGHLYDPFGAHGDKKPGHGLDLNQARICFQVEADRVPGRWPLITGV